MKAAVFYEPGVVKVQEWPDPVVTGDEVLIRVMACGVCGTDLHIYDGAKGASECNPPVVLGHELAGIVEKTGPDVRRVKVGAHVTVDPNRGCGVCPACQAGKPHFCKEMFATGVGGDGGFAQLCKAREEQIYQIRKDIPFEQAAMSEPLACCLHGIDQAQIKTGDTVLIIGGGTIGLLMVQLAKMAGAAAVIVSEPLENKHEMARSVGADYCINPMKTTPFELIEKEGLPGIDVSIECVGRTNTMQDALTYVSRGGHVLFFGLTPPDAEIPLKPYEVFQKELMITSSFVNPHTQGRAATLVNSGKLKLSELISDRLPLDEMNKAYEIRGKNGKMIIFPNN